MATNNSGAVTKKRAGARFSQEELNDGGSVVMDPRSLPVQSQIPSLLASLHLHPPTPSQQLLCPICPRRVEFAGAVQLEIHLTRVHYTSCRPYPCDACGGLDRFGTEFELGEHCRRAHGLVDGQFLVGVPQIEESSLLTGRQYSG